MTRMALLMNRHMMVVGNPRMNLLTMAAENLMNRRMTVAGSLLTMAAGNRMNRHMTVVEKPRMNLLTMVMVGIRMNPAMGDIKAKKKARSMPACQQAPRHRPLHDYERGPFKGPFLFDFSYD